jgi:hypothetical protein
MKRPGLLRAALAGGVAAVLTGGLGFTSVASAEPNSGSTATAAECPTTSPSPTPSPGASPLPSLPVQATPTSSPSPSPAPPDCPQEGEQADNDTGDEGDAGGDQQGGAPPPPPPPPPAEPPAPTPAPSGGVGAASLAGALGALTLPGEATEEEQREFRGPDVAEPPPLAAAPLIGGEFDRLLDFPEGMEPLLADDDREPGGAEAIFPDEPSFLATLLGAVEAEQALKSLAVMLLLLLTAAHVRSFIKAPTPEDSALD